MELGSVDLAEGILLSVHNPGLEGDKDLGQCHGTGICPESLKHSHPPSAPRCSQFDPAKVFRKPDGPDVVGDVTKPVLPDCQNPIVLSFSGWSQLGPENLSFDSLHVLPVLDQIGHFENTKFIHIGRHDGGGESQVDCAQLQFLEEDFIAAQLAGVENHNACPAPEALIGQPCELPGGVGKERIRSSNMTQLELENGLDSGLAAHQEEQTNQESVPPGRGAPGNTQEDHLGSGSSMRR